MKELSWGSSRFGICRQGELQMRQLYWWAGVWIAAAVLAGGQVQGFDLVRNGRPATIIVVPDETVEAFKTHFVGIKGPLTTPVGGGIRSLNVALRQLLG